MKKAAIVQSNYIPWKGYFDLIRSVDVFVIFDVVQYTKNDWRNRNRVIIDGAPRWLTIPVRHEHLGQKINETIISDRRWADKHWKTLEQNYRGCEHFEWCSGGIRDVYSQVKGEERLSSVNFAFIQKVAEMLGISTEIRFAEDFQLCADRQDRLIDICKELGCDTYVSGQSAKAYIDEKRFRDHNMELEWYCYEGYRPYPQRSSSFTHHVSILDMMFNVGEQTLAYIRRNKG